MRGLRYAGYLLAGVVLAIVATLGGFRLAATFRETQTEAQLAPMSGRWVQTSKGAMFIQEAGPANGTAIIMTHGTAAWSELWRETLTALSSQGYRAIAVDLPPFGFSERPPDRTYTRHDQAIRIRDVLDRLGIERAIVLGHSFGAGPAAELAMRFPSRVRALLLVNAALGLPRDGAAPAAAPGWLTGLLGIAPLRDGLVATTLTNPMLTQMLLASMLARKERALPDYVAILQHPMQLKASTADFGWWLQYFIAVDRAALSMSPEAFRRIAMPVSILWGDMDTVTPIEQGQRLAGLIPGSKLIPIARLGHIPQIEDPQLFLKTLRDVLANLALEPSR